MFDRFVLHNFDWFLWILRLKKQLAQKDPRVEGFLKDNNLKSSLTKAHLTLAHKRSHGVTAVASYGPHVNRNVPVNVIALLFTDKLAALEAEPGVVDDEKISSKNEWPHVTLWTAQGIAAKEANMLSHLHAQGNATRVEVNPPVTITGVLEFFWALFVFMLVMILKFASLNLKH